MRNFISIILLSLTLLSCRAQENHFKFEKFDEAIFINAQKKQKPVLLHLRANWCHWCHVMEKETYAAANVQKFLTTNYITAMEDHDDRADLTALYGQYGWPATLIFSPDGNLIFAEAGYIEQDEMLNILNQFKNPKNWKSLSNKLVLKPENKNETLIDERLKIIENQVFNSLDKKVGGFNSAHKFLELPTFDYAFSKIQSSEELKKWLQISVNNSYNLNDKEWGGVYQYSTHSDWEHLHYEKLLQFQGDYTQMYVKYYKYFKDEKALHYAMKIADYVTKFLTPENKIGFYNAQDADFIPGKKADGYFKLNNDARLKLGVPKIDSNIYTNTSMQYSVALLKLYEVHKNDLYLNTAQQTIENFIANRMVNGIMQHSVNASNIKNLTDQIYTIYALWELYKVSNHKEYLTISDQLIQKCIENFYDKEAHFLKAFIGKTALSATYNATENMIFASMLKKGMQQKFIKPQKYEKLHKQLMDFLTHPQLMDNYISEAALVNAWQ